MNEMSNKDLIQAHADAMARNINPKSANVEFAMQGLGSEVQTGEEMLVIT